MDSKEIEKQAEQRPEKEPARRREGPETEPKFELTKQKFTVRRDLEITEQEHRGEKFYVIKDPLALRYFRLSELEFSVFQLMDGTSNVDDIKAKIEAEFDDVELDVQTILNFAYQLKSINFLERVFAREDRVLYERAQERKKMLTLWAKLKNILFIKFALVDPDRFFEWSRPYMRIFFTRYFVVFCVMLFGFAFWELFHRFGNRVPWEQLFTLEPRNLMYFWIVFVVTKICHEIGHGVTCKHYGGEVHEMGFLLLVLMPCLYCDVSDAWIFKKRYQRLLVSAAGIVTELILAAMACLVWAFSDIALVKGLAYRMMLLCSISTVLFNANPLMKFDGYYMLSDYLEIPNLRARSTQYFAGYLKETFLGIEQPKTQISEEDASLYLVYGFGSTIWIWMLMFSICAVMLHKFYALGLWITATTIIGMFVMPIRKMFVFVFEHRTEVKVKRRNLAITGVIMLGFLYVGCFVRLDTWVRSPFVVKPVTMEKMKATIQGYVSDFRVQEGQVVKKGDVIAELHCEDVERERQKILDDIDRAKTRKRIAEGSGKTAEAKAVDIEIESLGKRLIQIDEQVRRETITAPFAGVVLRAEPKEELDRNLIMSRQYKPGDVLCIVAKLDEMMMYAYIEEEDQSKIQEGAVARAKVIAFPDKEFEARLEEKGKAGDQAIRDAEVYHLVPAIRTQQGIKSALVYYVAELKPTGETEGLRPGLTGEAKIYVGKRTMAQRIGNWAWTKIRTMFRV
ncbi:MAG: biotin/lipoyl-binding protein [Planctomycetes bacterium]|nr:biotin/lipoyl-binding protein [Planctomycetota bacterium]